MDIVVRVLDPGDGDVLSRVAPDVFDHAIDARWSAEFLADPRHHLAVAIEAGRVVAMASGVHYVHPDKAPQLWVNEIGVAPPYHRQGLGRRVLDALLERGRTLGCEEAWVLTDRANAAACRLYASAGGQEAKGETIMFEFRLGERPER